MTNSRSKGNWLRPYWNGTNLRCSPTWKPSTQNYEKTSDASYVFLEEILFSRKSFEESYTDQCIRQEKLHLESNSRRYHKSCLNPWLAGKSRTRKKSKPCFSRERILSKIADYIGRQQEYGDYDDEHYLSVNPWIAGKFRQPGDCFAQQPVDELHDFEIHDYSGRTGPDTTRVWSRDFANLTYEEFLEAPLEEYLEWEDEVALGLVDNDSPCSSWDSSSLLPQIGPEIIGNIDSILTSLSSYAGEQVSDEIVAHVEGLIALLIALQGTTDFLSAGAVLMLYFRKFSDRSLTSQVLEYLNEFFTPQGGEEGKEDESESYDWVEMMKNLHSNWTCVKDNKLFAHLSKLLGVVVTMEMCKISDVTFTIKDMKVFEPDLKVVHGNSVDVIDAALGSVSFFVEVFSLCYETKSLKPLIVNDTAALELDEEYAHICSFWGLVQNGNLKKVRGISENEFDRRLEKLTTKIRSLLPSLKGFDRKIVQDKFAKLLNIKNDYITMKISSGIRKSPFAIELFGPSSQGKSMISEQIIAALLTSAGLPTGKEYQANFNAGDKYMSSWTTDKLVMTIDDIANEKSDFVEKPPTRAIIDICNNQAFYANMADLASKGKVFVEPELVMVTTNVKDLDARAYSNCPYSIQRRMHVVITVQAKPEFQYKDSDGNPIGVDSDLVDALYEGSAPPLFDDIWSLTVERAVTPKKLSSRAGYEPIEFNGEILKNVGFGTVLNFLIDRYQKHIVNQEKMIARMKRRQRKMELCGIDGCKQIRGHCHKHPNNVCVSCESTDIELDQVLSNEEIERNLAEARANEVDEDELLADYDQFGDVDYADEVDPLEDYDPQWGEEIVDSISGCASSIYGRISSDLFGLGAVTEGAASFLILRAGRQFAKHWDWMSLVPTPWLQNERFEQLCMLASQGRIKKNYVRTSVMMWSTIGISSWQIHRRLPSVTIPLCSSLCIGGIYMQKKMVNIVKRRFRDELRQRNAIAPMFEDLRNKHIGNLCKAGGVVAVLYGIAKVYRAWRKKRNANEAQGSLEPTTQEEVDKRDSEDNPWTGVSQRPLPIQVAAKNTTSAQLMQMIENNLTYGSVSTKDGVMAVNCLFLRSNLALIPQHYFTSDEIEITFRKDDPETSGGTFTAKVSKSTSYFVPDTDIAMCFVPNGGSFKYLSKFLPEGELPKTDFDLTYRRKPGELIRAKGLASPCETGHSLKRFKGYEYANLSIETFRGMCGAVLSSTHRPMILGLHLGGQAGTQKGCAGILSFDQYKAGFDELRKMEGVLFTGTAEHFEKNVMGVSIMTGKPLHKKSPVKFQPHGSQISWLGSCIGHSTFKSRAKPTLISEHVMDVMNSPNIYCKPIESPQWEPWQTCLANMAEPGKMFSPELLYWAILDYKSDLIPIFKHDMWCGTRPLLDVENWNGVPGKKFLDRIKSNTSIGFPHVGKKERYLVEVEPFGDYTKIVEPVELIRDEIDRLLACYIKGERAYPIAKACKKDEVLSKRKCRIFYSNPVALTFLVRKYFLPLLRVLQFYPKISECAVGVNSHGPEWHELHDHIYTFGENRLIGGDYGKYDQKLPSQLLLASLRILIDFARCCDYSDEDITIMEALAGDLVYAVIAFNGDLISLSSGTHISGNSLTVILNGICGSLNLRCYFYNNHMPKNGQQLAFRDCVKLITYGDDNIGSVRKDIKNFTIKGASEFLANHGQVYTMPDKESELVDFLPPEEFEFLKRVSVFHPKLGHNVGALVEKSCFKMLHFYLRDKGCTDSEEYACAKNIDTACREWFNHGEDVYEERRSQLRDVANRAGVLVFCEELDKSYDWRVQEWKEKYL